MTMAVMCVARAFIHGLDTYEKPNSPIGPKMTTMSNLTHVGQNDMDKLWQPWMSEALSRD
jgi:hypothetical protein